MLLSCPTAIPAISWVIQLLGLSSHLIPPPSLSGGEGSSFPHLAQSYDVVDFESVVGMKPGDSSVVIVYQVDEFTCT